MTTTECLSDIISSLDDFFITNQKDAINTLLKAEHVFFLDTCFITKSFNIKQEKLFAAFEKIAGGKEKQKIVFVITELILYELKDSEANQLQEKNKAFFKKLSEYGFTILIINEETVCDNISPYMGYSSQKWNEIFSKRIHDNIATLSFGKIIRTDKRMPFFGFEEEGYKAPADKNFIKNIIAYLKDKKSNKDSMAEELVCTSLFFIFELTRGFTRSEYVFCTHDFAAIARMNKAIQTSYPNMQKQLKIINILGIVQYMVEEELLTTKNDVLVILRGIMEENTKFIILEKAPFASIEKTISIEEAVEMIFNKEQIVLVGKRT